MAVYIRFYMGGLNTSILHSHVVLFFKRKHFPCSVAVSLILCALIAERAINASEQQETNFCLSLGKPYWDQSIG